MILIAAFAVFVVLAGLNRHTSRQDRALYEQRLTALQDAQQAQLATIVNSAELERARLHSLIADMVADRKAERDQAADERVQLLNRIKPETAQAPLTQGPILAPPAISVENDEQYWESKEDLAERMFAGEVAS